MTMNEDMLARIRALPPEKRAVLTAYMRSSRQAIQPDTGARYEPFPLSATQRAYWNGAGADRPFARGSGLVYTELVITGPLDDFEDRLNHAFRALVERHDMLRIVFLPGGRQRVRERVDVPWIAFVPASSAEEVARRREEAYDFRFQFGSEVELPFRVWAFREGEHQAVVCILLSALIVDGTSRFRLGWELHMLLENPSAALPRTELSYRDCVLALRREQPDGAWIERTAQLPAPIPAQPETAGARFVHTTQVVLDRDGWERLKALGGKWDTGAAGITTTAFCEAVAQTLGVPSLTVAMMSSYRPRIHADVDNVIGNFNTSVPIAYHGDTGGSFAGRATAMQAQLGWILDHRDGLGFRYLRGVADQHGRARTRPASEMLVNSVFDYSAKNIWRLARIADAARYGIAERVYWFAIPSVAYLPTFAQDDDGSLQFKLAYASGLEETADRMRKLFVHRVERLLTDDWNGSCE
jgi:hypothetical protein